jgi:hypothetical protein
MSINSKFIKKFCERENKNSMIYEINKILLNKEKKENRDTNLKEIKEISILISQDFLSNINSFFNKINFEIFKIKENDAIKLQIKIFSIIDKDKKIFSNFLKEEYKRFYLSFFKSGIYSSVEELKLKDNAYKEYNKKLEESFKSMYNSFYNVISQKVEAFFYEYKINMLKKVKKMKNIDEKFFKDSLTQLVGLYFNIVKDNLINFYNYPRYMIFVDNDIDEVKLGKDIISLKNNGKNLSIEEALKQGYFRKDNIKFSVV